MIEVRWKEKLGHGKRWLMVMVMLAMMMKHRMACGKAMKRTES